jgi:hypothetical protein
MLLQEKRVTMSLLSEVFQGMCDVYSPNGGDNAENGIVRQAREGARRDRCRCGVDGEAREMATTERDEEQAGECENGTYPDSECDFIDQFPMA